jgi:dTDP-4-dehydrorhamnose 3,5-epimerase
VLEPGSELLNLHSGPWVPEAETSARRDVPELTIAWPLSVADLSEQDRDLPRLNI